MEHIRNHCIGQLEMYLSHVWVAFLNSYRFYPTRRTQTVLRPGMYLDMCMCVNDNIDDESSNKNPIYYNAKLACKCG